MNEKIKGFLRIGLLVFVMVSVAYAILNEVKKNAIAEEQAAQASKTTQVSQVQPQVPEKDKTVVPTTQKNKIVASYFYGNSRCPSCLKIEKWSHEGVEKFFKKELTEGSLEWQTMNMDKPINRQLVRKYKLFTKSLVVSLVENGEEKKWKNLEKVWELLADENKFKDYVKQEIDDLYKELKK